MRIAFVQNLGVGDDYFASLEGYEGYPRSVDDSCRRLETVADNSTTSISSLVTARLVGTRLQEMPIHVVSFSRLVGENHLPHEQQKHPHRYEQPVRLQPGCGYQCRKLLATPTTVGLAVGVVRLAVDKTTTVRAVKSH